MAQLVIQSPNDNPFAQTGEIGFFAAGLFNADPTDDATEIVQFEVVYPDRASGEIGAGGRDLVTVNRQGVVVVATSLNEAPSAP
jgi:hypothetical protein